ncbi:MAG: metallophosphoesterase [Candidatus Hydrogenedentota bacterium]
MSIHVKLWIAFVATSVSIASGCRVYASDAVLVREPYLQSVTSDSIVVVWRTRGRIDPVVRYGARLRSLKSASSESDVVLRVSSDVSVDGAKFIHRETDEERKERNPSRRDDPTGEANIYQYEVKIAGLEADSTYFYGIYDGDELLAGKDRTHRFTTSPTVGVARDTRIWVVGDSGTVGRPQRQVRDAMLAFTVDTKRPLDLYIHVGDMAYTDGANYEFQRAFFDIYAEQLRQMVVWPSMGNHEGHTSRGMTGKGPYYDAYVLPTQAEAGGVASGTEAYYSFDVGRIHFVCLDSHDLNRKSSGPMAQWLREDLNQATADWLIAFWHHPPYTKGSHDSDGEGQLIEMREEIMPILEDGGVDIVLTGHSHIYERSMLMDGAYATPTVAEGVILDDGDGDPDGDGAYRKSAGLNPHEGTIQIVTGHGGAGVRRSGTMPVMREIIVENGSVILDVDGDTLLGHMINRKEVIRDVFSIVKQGKVEVKRVENPWQHE